MIMLRRCLSKTILFILLTVPVRANAYTLLQFIPVIQLNQLYDDNINLASTNKKGDFISNLLLGFYLNWTGPERSGSFQYETIGELFLNYQKYDNFGQTHYFEMHDQEHLSDTTTVDLDNWFLTGKTPRSFFVSGGALTAPQTLNSQLALAILAKVDSLDDVADINIRHRWNEESAVSAELQEEYFATSQSTALETKVGLKEEYAPSPTLRGGLGYQFFDFRFSDAPSPVQAHFPQLEMHWEASHQLSFGGSAGPILFEKPQGEGQEVKLGYDGSLGYETDRWDLSVRGGQGPGITPNGGAGLTRSALSDIKYAWTRRFSLFTSMSYYELEGGGAPLQLLIYGAGISEQVTRSISVSVQYVAIREYGSSGDGVTAAPAGPLIGTTTSANALILGATIPLEVFRKGL
jgi:hypothetical protein